MNLDLVKDDIRNHLNQNVIIKVYGMRNKTSSYMGKINGIYPNLFTIIGNDGEKSFTYRDIITGEIKIKYE